MQFSRTWLGVRAILGLVLVLGLKVFGIHANLPRGIPDCGRIMSTSKLNAYALRQTLYPL